MLFSCWIATSAVHRFEWNSSVVKAVIIVTGAHLNLSTLFMVSRLLSAKVFPEWRLNADFGSQKRYPAFPWIDESPQWRWQIQSLQSLFPGPNFVSPEWRCPLNRVVPKERLHCTSSVFWVNLIYDVIVWSVLLNRVCSFRCGLKDVKDLHEPTRTRCQSYLWPLKLPTASITRHVDAHWQLLLV